jgi:hypothetical protein
VLSQIYWARLYVVAPLILHSFILGSRAHADPEMKKKPPKFGQKNQ